MDNEAISRTYLEVRYEPDRALSLVEFEDGCCALMHKGRVIAGPWNDTDVAEAVRAFRLVQAEMAAQAEPVREMC